MIPRDVRDFSTSGSRGEPEHLPWPVRGYKLCRRKLTNVAGVESGDREVRTKEEFAESYLLEPEGVAEIGISRIRKFGQLQAGALGESTSEREKEVREREREKLKGRK